MTAKIKPFDFDRDFLRVRDFLSKTFGIYTSSVNWRIERWEYAFGFIAPFLANWREDPPKQASVDQSMKFMDEHTGLWETEDGEVAGVVSIEHADRTHPGFSEFFIQRHPAHLDLLPEMLDYAEETLLDPEKNYLFIYVDPEDTDLIPVLKARGFTANPEKAGIESEYDLVKQPLPDSPNLPVGFRLQSMADDNDLPKRCKAFGTGFNHPDPLEWPSLISYEYLQRMPDYHKNQDIVVVAPDGEFAAFSLIWFDAPNKIASLEPVGTQPEYRRMGLAREAIYEGMRRVAKKGAERVIGGSDQPFYKAIGFKPVEYRIRFEKHYG
jgi:ribosomal protein S18 acetylase RimI-like enzyme